MPTVKAFVRTTGKRDVNIRFRYSDGRDVQLFHKSEIMINPAAFDEKRECVKAKVVFNSEKRKQIDKGINDRKELIKKLCIGTDKTVLTSEWLEMAIDKELRQEVVIEKEQSFFEAFEEFLKVKNFSTWRLRSYNVVIRALKRYELYVQITGNKSFQFNMDNVTSKTLGDFDAFLRSEHLFSEQYPELYERVPESRKPEPRGQNTINGIFSKIRSFYIWLYKSKKTTNNPFEAFAVEECVYGTPYYISIEERNQLYNADLSDRPSLAIQRDIFVFQCLIGCRVADLYQFTKQNVINDAIEYIARKTKDGRPVTVRVPLNSIAKEILAKYNCFEGKTLLPYISSQKYNKAIKEAFKIAGLTRPVVILDPLTRESVIRPLNEIASSHLARRCFVGNLYKQVKDPNLVGSLSGHKEGSKAFARYREIDEEMKKELVKMLE
ncbi:MAG: site-specific integrase [Dysgonamonadaceae bacterium]|jgi:integrase|nr:site-specific integrase [Dysgonamonadaceae bacterium]